MHKNQKPNIHLLNDLLTKKNIKLSQHQLEALWRYHKLIRKYNSECDLTRIFNFDSMVTKHYIDCMIITNYTELPSPLLDIGSGAGFPGIPLKILLPDIKITLCEPRPKRVEFLSKVISDLNLKNIKIHPHKLVKDSNINNYNGVITRAFETISKTLIRIDKILNINGKIIFMKGPNCTKEIGEANKTSPNYILENDIEYLISNKDKRRLVIFTHLKHLQ